MNIIDEIHKRMEIRRRKLLVIEERKRLAKYRYYARKYRETGNKKWVWMAYRNDFDVDYIPGQDDGEAPEGREHLVMSSD